MTLKHLLYIFATIAIPEYLYMNEHNGSFSGKLRGIYYSSGYTFEYVTEDHAIVVSYAADENENNIPDDEEYFTITSSVSGENGTIAPDGETSVLYGNDQAYTAFKISHMNSSLN